MNSVSPERSFAAVASDGGVGGQLSVAQLIDIMRRRWLLLAAVAVLLAGLTVAATFLMTPRYDAVARLKIDPTQRAVVEQNNGKSSSAEADEARIATEVQVLNSTELAQAIVRKLDLARDEEFVPKDIAAAGGALAEREAIASLRKLVTINRERDNYVVEIVARTTSADKSALIANTIAESYISKSVRQRTGVASERARFVKGRLDVLAADLQSLGAQIARYRSQAGIVQGAVSGTITDQQIAPLSTQLALAESASAAARAQLNAAQAEVSGGDIGAVDGVLHSSVIAELRRQRAEVAREKAQVDARYGQRHREAIRVAEQLAAIDRQLTDEASRTVAGLAPEARAASSSAAALRQSLSRLRNAQASENRARVVAEGLERQAKVKQQQYDELSQIAQNLNAVEGDREPTATILDRATPPLDPSTPNKPLFAALGVMLGLISGLGAVIAIELASSTVGSGEDLENRLGLQYLGAVPRLTTAQLAGQQSPTDYVLQNPLSSYAEALRGLRSSLLLNRHRLRSVAVLSALPGEGKTTTSISLGRVMALSGDRVLLIDCDLRRGGAAGLAPGHKGPGLLEVLGGEVTVDEAVIADEATGLQLLPLRDQATTARDFFSGDAMRNLLQSVFDRYDFVLLDTPPLLAVADSRTLAALADTSLLVVRSDHTPLSAVRGAVARLRQDGTRIMGAALTMVSKARRLGKNDPAYHYELYRNYHSN